jgi:segregation and condensation protein A
MTDEESPYTESYISPESYDTYDMRQQIMNHLLFYKAIIDEQGSGEKINKYMDLVEQLEKGLHIPIRDPFHKSIAITFELVIQEHMNPWNVDLLKFSNLYLGRVKEEEDIDFITAGKLMVMAWEILKRQTEDLMAKSATVEEPEDDWTGVDIAGDWYLEDDHFEFTKTVMDAPEIPLQERVWRPANRKVTLFELVEAFDEARNEVEVQRILSTERKKERVRLEKESRGKVKGMVHKENLEEDITQTWSRLENLEGNIPLSNICRPKDKEDRITTLVSILFLARAGRVRIWQTNFPRGEIYIKHITNGNGRPADISLISKDFGKGYGKQEKEEPKKKKKGKDKKKEASKKKAPPKKGKKPTKKAKPKRKGGKRSKKK